MNTLAPVGAIVPRPEHVVRAGLGAQMLVAGDPVTEIHVVPLARGGWQLRCDDNAVALSEHDTATDAEHAATAAARIRHTTRIVFHDRYARVRIVRAADRTSTTPPSGGP